ncbi:hypothetical protein K469DRAFT_683665 [Zopfia rhizophila CBS 207.26]|uniref:Uncharacterized protein n=1 Tax=Zopfia rhizophila CBS 207.26 TaxID=1314779 RepID=A0A6A6EEH7_9PEZI|nr:hypothetical protein K469DRAFT_683665 [Zopfia rhizophila CBS 207.26]
MVLLGNSRNLASKYVMIFRDSPRSFYAIQNIEDFASAVHVPVSDISAYTKAIALAESAKIPVLSHRCSHIERETAWSDKLRWRHSSEHVSTAAEDERIYKTDMSHTRIVKRLDFHLHDQFLHGRAPFRNGAGVLRTFYLVDDIFAIRDIEENGRLLRGIVLVQEIEILEIDTVGLKREITCLLGQAVVSSIGDRVLPSSFLLATTF